MEQIIVKTDSITTHFKVINLTLYLKIAIISIVVRDLLSDLIVNCNIFDF